MSFWSEIASAFGVKPAPSTANQAKERLQVVVSHQRRHRSSPDYLPMLEKDIMAVIAKYVAVEDDKVDIRFHRSSAVSTLEVNVELPVDAQIRPKRSASEFGGETKSSFSGKAEPKERTGTGSIELVGGKLVRKSVETIGR